MRAHMNTHTHTHTHTHSHSHTRRWLQELGSDHPDVAKTLNDMAIVYKKQQKYSLVHTHARTDTHTPAHSRAHTAIVPAIQHTSKC